MLLKIISAIAGLVAVGIFICKFKKTQMCRPWIMLAVTKLHTSIKMPILEPILS